MKKLLENDLALYFIFVTVFVTIMMTFATYADIKEKEFKLKEKQCQLHK